ncbi:MAG: NADH-ubiquinone oxidoreductase-F iron-sulfur binding region domain-containing protein [Burkholderiaceae bacterium]
MGDDVRVQRVPCVGRCADAPVAVVGQAPVSRAHPRSVARCLEEGIVECRSPVPPVGDIARSFDALAAHISAGEGPGHLIDALAQAGLRGMGGAGFPVARKWASVGAQAHPRVLVVNADEGEPGTFKDRYVLETHVDEFLEGMLAAAWALDCPICYIYLRDEYPGVRSALNARLAALASSGSLNGWKLPKVHLRRGAGAYVCGEESALIESIEGKRGMPRHRPPYVAERGLFDQPTLVHNVETLYWVSAILRHGPRWFAAFGRRGRRGPRLFSVSGRVREPGVKRAEAGISLRELVDEHCGGLLDGHELVAFMPGGASGGILPASLADEPLDFDTLQPFGAFIGSAAIVVLSDHDSVVDAARNAMRFFRHESCGQCTPCRVGTAKADALMAETKWDASLLVELSRAMSDASICGLGQAAPNPMLSVLRFFPERVGCVSQGAKQ